MRAKTGEDAEMLGARTRETGMYMDVHEEFERRSNNAARRRSCLL